MHQLQMSPREYVVRKPPRQPLGTKYTRKYLQLLSPRASIEASLQRLELSKTDMLQTGVATLTETALNKESEHGNHTQYIGRGTC